MSVAHIEVEEIDMQLARSGASWPLYWSAVFVGGLSALALTLVFGLTAIAIGATQTGQRITTWHEFGFAALVFAVFGAFLSFAVGGWVAAKVAGLPLSEPAMLHGAIVWLITIPALLVFAALGAGTYFGGWYTGLGGIPIWAGAAAVPQDPAVVAVARNSALGAIAALLLGLMGGVVGGWMGSGEPMTFTQHRRRS